MPQGDLAFLTEAHRRNLADEEVGVAHRTRTFYLPLFNRYCRARGIGPSSVRLLDCGCGNGASVELLRAIGFEAYGIDRWLVRQSQWRERAAVRTRFCLADATWLPFRDAVFDIVTSSGLIEHIGVEEVGHPRYVVRPLPDQRIQRQRFISECLRVVRPGGVVYVDHPNGAFPIDFWHNDYRSRPRPHWPWERFLPDFKEIAHYIRVADQGISFRALSPGNRFIFRRSQRRWYGRLFKPIVERYFAALARPPFTRLAGWPINPYLVFEITRPLE